MQTSAERTLHGPDALSYVAVPIKVQWAINLTSVSISIPGSGCQELLSPIPGCMQHM